jgi:hypothetical protein
MANKSIYLITILIIVCIYVCAGCIIFSLLSYNSFMLMLSNIYNLLKTTGASAHLYVTQTLVNTLPLESTRDLIRSLPDDSVDIVKCRQKEANILSKHQVKAVSNQYVASEGILDSILPSNTLDATLPYDDNTITQCTTKEISANDVPIYQAVQSYDPKIVIW